MKIPDHYSLVANNPDHFVLHDHRDNKRFQVAKHVLDHSTQGQVMKIKKYADGGDVEEDDQAADITPQEAAPQTQGPDVGSFVPQYGQPQAQPGWQAPMLPQTVPQGQPQQAGNAEGQIQVPAQPQAQMDPFDQQALAAKQAAGAQMGMAKDQENAVREYQNNLAAERIRQQEDRAKLDAQQERLQKGFESQQIDPNRVYHNMRTGQRIGTAISMVLSGIGSGLTGKPNLAMEVMNKAIDNDIQAQKDNLGKTHSLLALNMQKYHNSEQAEAATRLQYATMLQTQLQMAQAKATNGMAAAALNNQLGQIQQNKNMYAQQVLAYNAKARAVGAGGGEGGLPEGSEPPMLLMDPKYQENRVVVNGRAYQATDKEGASKVRDVETLAAPVAENIQKLNELALDPTTKIAGTPNYLRAQGIIGDLAVKLPLLSGAQIGAKRINSEEIKHQLDRIQNPTYFSQSAGQLRNDEFLNSLQGELESTRKNHLLGYHGGANTLFKPATGPQAPLPRN